MSRVVIVEVPECADDEWMRQKFREMNSVLESLYERKMGSDTGQEIAVCLDILDALQSYAGY